MPMQIDRLTRRWAAAAVAAGVAIFFALELREEPDMSPLDMVLQLVEVLPVVLMSVGLALLFRIVSQQRDEQLTLLRDLEVARLQGQRWRAESRALLNGLGDAIETQFSRWNFTDAEREVALLLLKGKSHKEIAHATGRSERTVRQHAVVVYQKSGCAGRAELAAFFLEDLVLPSEPNAVAVQSTENAVS